MELKPILPVPVPKKIKPASSNDSAPAIATPAAGRTVPPAIPQPAHKKKTPSKASAKKTGLVRKAGSAIAKERSKKASKGKSAAEPTDAEVQLRAYFIAERRMQLSLSGDSAHDWLEAKRQLVAEAQESSM